VKQVTKGMKGQTMLRPKRHTMIHKTLHMKLNIEQHEPIKASDELLYFDMVSSACFTSSIGRVTLAKNPMRNILKEEL
jgi:hypothetical protein